MNLESIKQMVTVALAVAKQLVVLTESKMDDGIVAFVEKIAASDVVWSIIASLFKFGPVPVPPNDGGLIMMGAAGEVTPIKMGGTLLAESTAAGVSNDDLGKALAGVDLKGIDFSQIAMLVQLAIAIFKAIKK